jgi:ACS family hexuronate transporter-like MFS transporter
MPIRWWIGALLFLSTVINYIDRQTLSVLAPYIKVEYKWTNTDFALLIIAFRIAYSIGQTAAGRILDAIGTRRGLTFSVLFYSAAAMLTSCAVGLRSFCAFRFLLGLGEAANWPGAAKAVSEWFPARERGWAVALYDSGSAIGAAIAPALVVWALHSFGSWRPVFVVTGSLGLLWVLLFRTVYPRKAPDAITDSESRTERSHALPVRALLSQPKTWGIIISKMLTDPVWFFITDWFAIYLVSKGYQIENSLMAFWLPFVAADIGNFAGGGVSSYLITRGWNVVGARKAVVVASAVGMALLGVAAFTDSYAALIGFFSISTLSYAALSTMILALPADVYPPHSVASVSGMSGTGAGIGTILATYLIGRVADATSFAPVLVVASVMPLLAMLTVLTMIPSESAATTNPDRGTA